MKVIVFYFTIKVIKKSTFPTYKNLSKELDTLVGQMQCWQAEAAAEPYQCLEEGERSWNCGWLLSCSL